MSGVGANAAERERWNDPAWTGGWVPREQLTGVVTPLLLEHLALSAGQSVLDVGSGGGQLSLAMADRVSERGSVVGIDFSSALVDLARSRSERTASANTTFVLADAQVDHIPGGPFDVVASQFGVMFFDDPRAAFANIAAHAVAGARLVFACWSALAANPWCVTPTIAAFLPPPPVPPAGSFAAGPFSFGDADLVQALLARAGWVEVERYQYRRVAIVERAALVDDAHALAAVASDRRDQAERALSEQLATFDRSENRFEVPLDFQIFSARRS